MPNRSLTSYLELGRERIHCVLRDSLNRKLPADSLIAPGMALALDLLRPNDSDTSKTTRTKKQLADYVAGALVYLESIDWRLKNIDIEEQHGAFGAFGLYGVADPEQLIEDAIGLGIHLSQIEEQIRSIERTTAGAAAANESKRGRMRLLDELVDEMLPKLQSSPAKAEQIRTEFKKRYPLLKVPSVSAIKDRIANKSTKTLSVPAGRPRR